MKTFNTKISVFIAILMLGANILLAQEKTEKERNSKKEKGQIENLVSDLTDNQKDQLSKLAKEYREKTVDFRKNLKETNEELRKLKSDPNAKETDVYKKMDEVTDLRNKLDKENYSYKKQIEKVLTPKQVEELRAKETKMKNKRMEIRNQQMKAKGERLKLKSENMKNKSEKMKIKSDELKTQSDEMILKSKEKVNPEKHN